MYGAQTEERALLTVVKFENDVEMYGAQTIEHMRSGILAFENDVEMYGAQTGGLWCLHLFPSLRMM